jgi:hypothetical protein
MHQSVLSLVYGVNIFVDFVSPTEILTSNDLVNDQVAFLDSRLLASLLFNS